MILLFKKLSWLKQNCPILSQKCQKCLVSEPTNFTMWAIPRAWWCLAAFLPHICTDGRRHRTGNDTAHLHRTPALEPQWGTGSLVSEAHCPDMFPDLSCQKNKPSMGLASLQRFHLCPTREKKSCDKISHERERKGILLMGISKQGTWKIQKTKWGKREWQTVAIKRRDLDLYGTAVCLWNPLKSQ